MEPRIQYAQTKDGVSIAYATVGQGPPLVRVLGWFTHLEYERQMPDWERSMLGGLLAGNHLWVRYDGRGMGLSDRDVEDFSLDAKVKDLEAVINALQLERCAILGISEGGPTAIAYAVRHPDTVSHLILYGSFGGSIFPDTEEGRQRAATMLNMVRLGWGSDLPAHRQFFTGTFIPDADGDTIRWFNEQQRVSASADNVRKLLEALLRSDVTSLLPEINTPTLVIHRRNEAAVPFDRGRELASLIPGAQFLPLEGRNHLILPDEPESEAFRKAIEEFLREGEAEPETGKELPPSGLVTILFTDVEGSTALTQRLGDAKARELLREHERIVREALKAHGGSEVKTMGDGFMTSFSSVTKALECAIAMQRAFAERNESAEEPIRVRIGLNAGEPIAEDDDLFGTTVNEAARITATAKGGEILASDVVRQLVKGKDFLFSDVGERQLKGLDEPVRLYEVRWREEG
jgi:class 3 adenylate cyclase